MIMVSAKSKFDAFNSKNGCVFVPLLHPVRFRSISLISTFLLSFFILLSLCMLGLYIIGFVIQFWRFVIKVLMFIWVDLKIKGPVCIWVLWSVAFWQNVFEKKSFLLYSATFEFIATTSQNISRETNCELHRIEKKWKLGFS